MNFSKDGFFRYSALLFGMMASGGNQILPREFWLVLCALSCLTLLNWRLPLFKSRRLIYLWIVLVDALALYQEGPVGIPSIISKTGVFLLSVLLIEVYLARSMERLMQDLFNIGRLMSIQAIITYILGALAANIFMIIDVDGISHHTLGFIFNYHQVGNVVTEYIRPNGFFYEPGVFQIYISIFLYLCLYWRLNLTWAIIACAAQVTLWSTTGLIITIVLLVLAFRRIYLNLRGLWRPIIISVYILSLSFMLFLGSGNIIEKTEGDLRGSNYARLYDLNTGISIVENKPITGIGFRTETYLKYSGLFGFEGTILSAEQTSERPNTNGLLQILYSIGLPLGLVLLIGVFKQQVFSARLPMAILLAASLYAEPLGFTPFFLFILLSWILMKRPNPKTQRLAS